MIIKVRKTTGHRADPGVTARVVTRCTSHVRACLSLRLMEPFLTEKRLVGSRKYLGLIGKTFLSNNQRRIKGKREALAQLKNRYGLGRT